MNAPAAADYQARFVGLNPWLPWPLSAWRWWTLPVRAERLAVMRIGLALMLLIDLFLNYHPYVEDFFTVGSMGDPEFTGWYGKSPLLWWSLFRGFQDPLLSFLALALVLVLSVYLGVEAWGRLQHPAGNSDSRRRLWPIVLWLTACIVLVLGVWARDLGEFKKAEEAQKKITDAEVPGQLQSEPPKVTVADWNLTGMTWGIPLGVFIVAWIFWVLESVRIVQSKDAKRLTSLRAQPWWWTYTLAMAILFILFVFGLVQRSFWMDRELDDPLWAPGFWQDFLLSWQEHPDWLRAAFWAWAASVFGLLLGWHTRACAIAAWVFSTSFANINSNIDNAGDTVRGIILFYLMICPCGAAFSLDAWRARRRGLKGPVFISPWPLRLLFIQMVFIYWCNGLYKLNSKDWREGESLYLVLSDLTLTRVSHALLDLPHWLTKVMTFTVLAWELTFPLLVCNRWTRPPALIMGVLFHLGIFFSMELGGFAPYMWTLYLPFLPWERWFGPKMPVPEPTA